MKRYLYLYQIEKYETKRFLKKVYKLLTKKLTLEEYEIKWDLKSRFILYYSFALFAILSAVSILLLPYYIFIPIILLLWILKFLIIIFAETMFSLYEKRSNNKKFDLAKQKITAFNEVRFIAIAGSSGKTSVRKILKEVLEEKTASTSDNDETLSNLVDAINQDLTLGLKNFVVEMNSYKLGTIKKMCELTRPRIGILTCINEQHLERYKKIENTIQSKFELLENLTEDGIGIVNLDNALIRENLNKSLANMLVGYTIDGHGNQHCDKILSVENYVAGVNGSKFTIDISGQKYEFQTKLIGKKHISNLLAVIACSLEIGLEPEYLMQKISDLEQLSGKNEIAKRNGIYILDNSSGSNVDEFRDNLEFISKFHKKKVVVTPGIYEVGEKSKEVHKMIGFMISKVADLIVLLGESNRTENIRAGALDNNFDKNKIIRVKDLEEVYRFIDKNLGDGDVALLENDLDLRFL